EGLIREQLLELQANLFPALGPAVAGENGAAIRHELIEVVGHCCLLRTRGCLASLIAPANARAMALRFRHSLPLLPAGSVPFVPAKAGTQPSALDSRFRGNERRSEVYRGSCNPLTLTLSPTGERELAEFAAPSSAMALSKACPSSSASAALISASSVAPELLR